MQAKIINSVMLNKMKDLGWQFQFNLILDPSLTLQVQNDTKNGNSQYFNYGKSI